MGEPIILTIRINCASVLVQELTLISIGEVCMTAWSGGLLLAVTLLPILVSAEEPIVVPADSGVVTLPFVISNHCCMCRALGAASGRALYHFTITNGGTFVLQVLVNAPDGQTNSVSVNIDAEPEPPAMIWEVPKTAGFTNQLVSWRGEPAPNIAPLRRKVFTLAQGDHRLIIRGEAGTVQVARIAVLSLPPPPTGLHVITGPGP
jgi:hypothetical protein